MKLTVCLVSQQYPPETARGGIGSQTWNKARTLTRLGHTVHVLSCMAAASTGPDLRTELVDGVTVHRMQPPGEEPGKDFPVCDPSVYMLGYTWSVLGHLQRLVRAADIDLVEFAEYGAEGFAFQLNQASYNRVPVVVQLHGPLALLAERLGWPEKDSPLYHVGTFMEGVSITRAEGVMACSGNIADFTSGFYGLSRECIDVVHCGVDAEAFRPADEPERTESRPTVLFIGNSAEGKGLTTAFKAVLHLRRKYPDIRFQIVGDVRKALDRYLLPRARCRGAEANVDFIGFVDDRARLPDFYRGATVFCSPARHEGGVANVYIEAMACGCPVVASTSGGAAEAVLDGVTGLLVPPDSVEATAAALDRILGDRSLRRRMAQASRQRVDDYFAMDKYILRVLATYRRAIRRSRQPGGRAGGHGPIVDYGVRNRRSAR